MRSTLPEIARSPSDTNRSPSATDGVPQLRKGLDPTIIAPPTTKKTIR
jgi:hypothetical protein